MANDGQSWDDWIARHLELFGTRDDREDAERDMLGHWTWVFARDGLTPADLIAASEWLVTHNAPTSRLGMLSALQNALKGVAEARRAQMADEIARTRQRAANAQETACPTCSGTGRVTVPRLDCIRDGVFYRPRKTFGTAVVLCLCPLGQWFWERQRDHDPQPWTIDQYEQRNPDWFRQLYPEEAARASASRLDDRRGQLRRTLADLARGTEMPDP